jgi:hypothetical protein
MLGRSADDREQDGEGHDPRANLVGRLVARCDAETPSALENDCTVNTLRAGLSAGRSTAGEVVSRTWAAKLSCRSGGRYHRA